jgi:hypothetical protein
VFQVLADEIFVKAKMAMFTTILSFKKRLKWGA